MTPKQKRFVNFVEYLVSYFVNVLNLHEWQITIEHLPTPKDEEACAEISTNYTYLQAHIKCYDAIENYYHGGYAFSLAQAICHELCHIHVDELYKIAVDSMTNTSIKFLDAIRERQVTRITSAIMNQTPEEVYSL